MATEKNDKCENCGACKSCGSGGTKFVPYPVYYPNPYAQPYRPYFQPQTWPQPYYTSIQAQGISPNTAAGGGTYTTNVSWQNTAGGNYLS